jgi:hypothetical protein
LENKKVAVVLLYIYKTLIHIPEKAFTNEMRRKTKSLPQIVHPDLQGRITNALQYPLVSGYSCCSQPLRQDFPSPGEYQFISFTIAIHQNFFCQSAACVVLYVLCDPVGVRYPLWASRNSYPLRQLPSLAWSLLNILVCIISHDAWFYYGHRFDVSVP